MTVIRKRDACPNVRELRQLLGDALGVAKATQSHLAELVGCSLWSIIRWEQGKRPSLAYLPRLVALEKKLQEMKASSVGVASGAEKTASRPGPLLLPFFASTVSVKIEGNLSYLRFEVNVPSDDDARMVADLIVPTPELIIALTEASIVVDQPHSSYDMETYERRPT